VYLENLSVTSLTSLFWHAEYLNVVPNFFELCTPEVRFLFLSFVIIIIITIIILYSNRLYTVYKMAAKILNSARLKFKPELSKSLASLLECPVCFELMGCPIIQCLNGHNICSKCKPRVNLCPTCRWGFVSHILLKMLDIVFGMRTMRFPIYAVLPSRKKKIKRWSSPQTHTEY